MVVYNCPRCGYSTSNKSYYRKHLLRRNPCKVVLQDINIEVILNDIEKQKIRSYKKKPQLKKTSLKSKNVTKNGSKSNYTNLEEETSPDEPAIKLSDRTIVVNKNVTKSQISVSRKNLTLKVGKTRVNNFPEKTNTSPIVLKNDAYTDPKTQSGVSRNVSMQKVTLKPPETRYISNPYNNDPRPIVQKKEAYAKEDKMNGVSRNVSMQKVTLKPPESSTYIEEYILDDGTIMHKKEAYARSSQNRGVSRNVSMSDVTFNSPESYINQDSDNYTTPGIMQNYEADENNIENYKVIQKKIITNKPNRIINNYYCDINEADNLHNDEFNNTINDDFDSEIYTSERLMDSHLENNNKKSVEYKEAQTKSAIYYNNFDASPVMKTPHRNHYSPNKLHTTNMKSVNTRRYYRHPSDYVDDSFDEEYIDDHACSYCGKYFNHRQSKWRHEKKCNSKNVLADKCSRLEKQNKEKDDAIQQLKRQMEIMMEKVGSEVHNHNHNTTNYTFNVVLNAFGNERTDYINSSKVKQILDQGGAIDCIPRLLKAIHFSPEHSENRNVMIPNRKDNIAKIWDGSKWVLKSKNITLNEMTDKAYNILNEHYEEGNKQLDQFNDKYANGDKSTKRRVIQDTELMIINNGKGNIKTITN